MTQQRVVLTRYWHHGEQGAELQFGSAQTRARAACALDNEGRLTCGAEHVSDNPIFQDANA